MEQDTFKRFKKHKIAQLILAILFFIAYFLLLFFTPDLCNNIYTNKNLWLLCSLLWLFMIYSFTSLLLDFKKLRESIAGEHLLNRKAYLDHLTGIPNRYSCDLIFDTYKNADNIDEIGCVLITISNLGEINEKEGHEAGDQTLQTFSALLEDVASTYGFVGRNGGNEFIAVLENCTESYVLQFLNDISEKITQDQLPIKISYAYALNHYEKVSHFMDLVSLVYRKLL